MLAAVRETTPLVMKLPLPRHGLSLYVHYDTQGRPAKADLVPIAGNERRRTWYDVAVTESRHAA
jgi:hypothetical protein